MSEYQWGVDYGRGSISTYPDEDTARWYRFRYAAEYPEFPEGVVKRREVGPWEDA